MRIGEDWLCIESIGEISEQLRWKIMHQTTNEQYSPIFCLEPTRFRCSVIGRRWSVVGRKRGCKDVKFVRKTIETCMMQNMTRSNHTINRHLQGANDGVGDREPTKVNFNYLKKVIFLVEWQFKNLRHHLSQMKGSESTEENGSRLTRTNRAYFTRIMDDSMTSTRKELGTHIDWSNGRALSRRMGLRPCCRRPYVCCRVSDLKK